MVEQISEQIWATVVLQKQLSLIKILSLWRLSQRCHRYLEDMIHLHSHIL